MGKQTSSFFLLKMRNFIPHNRILDEKWVENRCLFDIPPISYIRLFLWYFLKRFL
jgi:hypothetical protein